MKRISYSVGLATLLLATAAAADYTVRGKGRLVLTSGAPVARVKCQLMDADPDDDEVLATGRTDSDGRCDLTGRAEDDMQICDNCDRPDPYLKFTLNDPHRVDVEDIWGWTWRLVTKHKDDKKGTIDFGNIDFKGEGNRYLISFAAAEEAYDNFRRISGDTQVPGHDGVVGVTSPQPFSAGTCYTGTENIHVPSGETCSSSMPHEFGHRLRHAADGGADHFNLDLMWFRYLRSHNANLHSNLGYAFNEGWAEYYARAVQDPDRQLAYARNADYAGGDETEGNVSHKLMRLSLSCGGFKPMWRALKAGKGKSIPGGPAGAQAGIHSYRQFETVFMHQNPKCELKPASYWKADKKEDEANEGRKKEAERSSRDSRDVQARAERPLRVKWDSTRLAKLPASVRPSMTRIEEKRTTHAKARVAKARIALRDFESEIRPNIEGATVDPAKLASARSKLLKILATERLSQLDEIQKDLKGELVKVKDKRFRAYLERRLAKSEAQAAEIRESLANPGPKLPDALMPPDM